MVEKIIVNPQKIRGLGNILSAKAVSDFDLYNSVLSESEDTVYGATKSVFVLESDTTHDYSIAFSSSTYTAVGGSATLDITLLDNNVPVSGATVTVTGSDSSLYTGITNSTGKAEITVSVSSTTTFTCSYSNVSDTCTVIGSTFIYSSDMTSDDGYWIASGGNRTITYSSDGCKVLGTGSQDGFYKLDETKVTIPSTFYVEFDITEATQGAYSESTGFVVGNISIRKQSNQLYIGYVNGTSSYTMTFPSYPVAIKVEFGSTVSVYVNDTLINQTWTGDYQYIGFKTYSQRSMTVKNVEIGNM